MAATSYKSKVWYAVLLLLLVVFWGLNFSANLSDLFIPSNLIFSIFLIVLLVYQVINNRRGFWLIAVIFLAVYSSWIIYVDLLLQFLIDIHRDYLRSQTWNGSKIFMLGLKLSILVLINIIVWVIRPRD